MNHVTSRLRNLAGQLLRHEAKSHRSSGTRIPAALHVCEKLREPLATLMGHAGFHALLARTLTLAAAEVPALRAVEVRADGSLAGLEELAGQIPPKEFMANSVVLVAQLLGLLVAFIGEKLTLKLVRETWLKLSETPPGPGKGQL